MCEKCETLTFEDIQREITYDLWVEIGRENGWKVDD
jgi:hypothetical protein